MQKHDKKPKEFFSDRLQSKGLFDKITVQYFPIQGCQAIKQRNKVKEVILFIVANKRFIAKRSFPNAALITDRFHVQKLATEALQEIRIKHRWEAIDQENEAIEEAKSQKKRYEPVMLSNGDTVKQLLARSRYSLYKRKEKWTLTQKERAELVFDLYSDIEKAYKISQRLTHIFNHTKDKIIHLLNLPNGMKR